MNIEKSCTDIIDASITTKVRPACNGVIQTQDRQSLSFYLAFRGPYAPSSLPAALVCRGIGRLLHREGAKRACELLCALGHSSFPISPLFVRMGDRGGGVP